MKFPSENKVQGTVLPLQHLKQMLTMQLYMPFQFLVVVLFPSNITLLFCVYKQFLNKTVNLSKHYQSCNTPIHTKDTNFLLFAWNKSHVPIFFKQSDLSTKLCKNIGNIKANLIKLQLSYIWVHCKIDRITCDQSIDYILQMEQIHLPFINLTTSGWFELVTNFPFTCKNTNTHE